jgi:hypothetical protein
MPDFGFVGPSYVAASIYQDDQECINWYPEIDPFRKDRGVIALYPTPGLVPVAQLPLQAEVRGLFTNTGSARLLAAVGNQVISLDKSYAQTFAGTLNTSSGPVSIVDNRRWRESLLLLERRRDDGGPRRWGLPGCGSSRRS